MPKYTVTDPTSGKKLTFTGDVPPKPEHIMEAFAQLNAAQPSALAQGVSSVARPVLEIGGMVGGGLLAGGATAPTVLGAVPATAAGGALGYAGGKSAADLLDRGLGIKKPIAGVEEALGETVSNVVGGVEAEATGAGVAKAIGGAAKLGKAGVKKLITGALGPTAEEIAARAANPEAIKGAKPMEELAQSLPDSFHEMSKKITEMSDAALEKLSPSKFINDGAATKTDILGAVRKEATGLGRTISDSTAHAKKVLGRYADRLKKLGSTVSEKELGSIVRSIDEDIDWSAKELAPLNNALEGVRTRIDTILKTGNKEYAAAMEPVAENMRLLKKGQKVFGIENDIGKGYKATNSTATALKSATDPKRLDSRAVLERLNELVGKDYLSEAEASKVAEAFKPGAKTGGKRLNVGAAIGAAAGTGIGSTLGFGHGMVGGATGAVAGGMIDANAGPIAGSLIDSLVKLSKMTKGANTPAVKSAVQDLLGSAAMQRKSK